MYEVLGVGYGFIMFVSVWFDVELVMFNFFVVYGIGK